MTETPTEIPDEQRRIIEMLCSVEVSAPQSLHRSIESLVATHLERHGARRALRPIFSPGRALAGVSVALATVAAVAMVGLGGGGNGPTVSFSQAAAPTLRAATLPAPPESR